jgi:MarR family 2-MHQ and catechol resistance regulon transcriptional repressor
MTKTINTGDSVDLSLNLWLKFVRSYAVYRKKAADHLKNFGLTTTQFMVIECLGHYGPLIMGDLCKKTFFSGSNMTFIADGLEKLGFVERKLTEDDRRAIIVRLTPKGEILYGDALSKHGEFLHKLAAVLTMEEKVELGRLLKKLGLALSE